MWKVLRIVEKLTLNCIAGFNLSHLPFLLQTKLKRSKSPAFCIRYTLNNKVVLNALMGNVTLLVIIVILLELFRVLGTFKLSNKNVNNSLFYKFHKCINRRLVYLF